MSTPVSIVSISSFSPLGTTPQEVWENYLKETTLIQDFQAGAKIVPAAALTEQQKHEVEALKKSDSKYSSLDNSVLYSLLASREALKEAGWGGDDVFGINIGSSRGATDLFEKHHSEFLETGKTAVQASPVTTLGNISSWVAQDLKSTGPEISHSITCSTALHALLNGVAWLRAGMADKFLVGGSEAPLTPFTIAQMQAMKIYSTLTAEYPCRALDLDKKANTMVLGEGAASACLELGKVPNALAYIDGVGYATETLKHSVSISDDAECMQKSMIMALRDTPIEEVDAIVMHAPGTIKGDLSEYKAIQKIFSDKLPLLTTNKWKIGHTFGSSGLLSLEFAVLMLQHNHFVGVPFVASDKVLDRPLKKILVNAVGFGGNAVSILLSK
ncbi:beta-ketoacyl synthase N-terminal-like domain-containing protein [Flavobacterium cerinum]|uniref:Beta-ketoacyl synthase n=1 Tax=Flavobacterium cerinum TaxID=2502784 RepID=A0A3S3QD08_9FLAO|nr:beta-ketoacyl synthase N-terminal-like domain-containing protein [Flavobacterium cerinum]RWX00213.1 beta-ketoacyl synthase [Flavobacterium cerinum]